MNKLRFDDNEDSNLKNRKNELIKLKLEELLMNNSQDFDFL